MVLIFSIFILLLSFSIFFQKKGKGIDYKQKWYHPVKNTVQTESLKHSTYTVDYEFKRPNDSIKPVGQIKFWRTESVGYKISKEIYGRPWTASFHFYSINDLEFCERMYININRVASCLPPYVGGDLIIIQNFVLINRSVCVNCFRYDNGIDYCRPTLNKILSELNLNVKRLIKENW